MGGWGGVGGWYALDSGLGLCKMLYTWPPCAVGQGLTLQQVVWHPGQATTWHSGVCQIATGKQQLAVPCCPPAKESSWLDHPCQAATRAPPKWVCWLAQFVLATSGLGHHAKLPPEIPANNGVGLPSLFSQLGASQHP